jgi:hypothetical protein
MLYRNLGGYPASSQYCNRCTYAVADNSAECYNIHILHREGGISNENAGISRPSYMSSCERNSRDLTSISPFAQER